jgi:DNA-binding FrmR family transcriptional regulator
VVNFVCVVCPQVKNGAAFRDSRLENAKRALIHDHMDHCLDAPHSAADRDELKAIS